MPSYKGETRKAGQNASAPARTVYTGGRAPADTTNFQRLRKAWESNRLIASATAASAASASPAAISTTAATVPVTSTASAMFRLRTGFVYVKRTTANF